MDSLNFNSVVIDDTLSYVPWRGDNNMLFDILKLIGLAKESKLRNSAPIKYQIEISQKYWESIFRSEGMPTAVESNGKCKISNSYQNSNCLV